MSDALRLAFAVGLMLIGSRLAAAQVPAMPSATMLADTGQSLPAGRSVWKSQDGSTLAVTIDVTTGTLTGTFAPGFPCGVPLTQTAQAAPSQTIVGAAMGNAVVWTVSLPDCPSVGTWIGHYQTVGAEQQLTLLWMLALPESPPGVGSTFTGSALFIRQSQ